MTKEPAHRIPDYRVHALASRGRAGPVTTMKDLPEITASVLSRPALPRPRDVVARVAASLTTAVVAPTALLATTLVWSVVVGRREGLLPAV